MINLADVDIKGAQVIIPMVSVANVPQLAVDLIIQNTHAKKVASVWHDAFLPFVGPDPFNKDSDGMFTTIEAYFCKEKNILVFQMRSPMVGAAKAVSFVTFLCKWLKSCEVERVIILSSMYSYLRLDDEIRDESENFEFRYIESPLFNEKYGQKTPITWSPFLQGSRAEICNDEDPLGLKYVGAGAAHLLYNECVSSELPVIVLLKFASDGYNIPDAERYVQFLNKWLPLVPSAEKLKHPYSWECLYETSVPEMYF